MVKLLGWLDEGTRLYFQAVVVRTVGPISTSAVVDWGKRNLDWGEPREVSAVEKTN